MGLLEDCKNVFGTSDLYEVLRINRSATPAEIKKAYKKLSLTVHPDKSELDKVEEATRKFQILSKAHCVLSDENKKAFYDETGQVDDECGDQDKDWGEYWRLLFPRITLDDINNFMTKYTGSKEERDDLKAAYLAHKGDMTIMSEYIIGYTYADEDRYSQIFNEMIDADQLPDYPAFSQETAAKKRRRQKKFEKEAREAQKMDIENSKKPESLATAIAKRSQQRESEFNDMISRLEEKYAKKPTKKKKK